MKKLLLLLITIITFTNVSYASFPITENSTSEVLISLNFGEEVDENDEPSIYIYIFRALLMATILFFGIRAWVKGFRKKRWVRIVTISIFSLLLLFITLALSINYGYSGG
jgi:hypothetical protein